MAINPERDIQYFSWADQKAINAAIVAPLAKGEPLNIVGHSLGGSAAIIGANSTGVKITNLITIDPVARTGSGKKPYGVVFWGNVIAASSGPRISLMQLLELVATILVRPQHQALTAKLK